MVRHGITEYSTRSLFWQNRKADSEGARKWHDALGRDEISEATLGKMDIEVFTYKQSNNDDINIINNNNNNNCEHDNSLYENSPTS